MRNVLLNGAWVKGQAELCSASMLRPELWLGGEVGHRREWHLTTRRVIDLDANLQQLNIWLLC